MRKVFLVLFAVLSLTLGVMGTASATQVDPNEAAERGPTQATVGRRDRATDRPRAFRIASDARHRATRPMG